MFAEQWNGIIKETSGGANRATKLGDVIANFDHTNM